MGFASWNDASKETSTKCGTSILGMVAEKHSNLVRTIMSAEQTACKTRRAWDMFSIYTNEQLDVLLNLAGVMPCQDRGLKLQQVLCVWFHGFIPNWAELIRLNENIIKI